MENNIDFNKLSDGDKELVMQNLCENLPILRKKLGLTQEDLAQQLGITRQTIASFEAKKRKMNWVTAVALLMFFSLNVSTSVLLGPLGILSKNVINAIPILGGVVDFAVKHFKKK